MLALPPKNAVGGICDRNFLEVFQEPCIKFFQPWWCIPFMADFLVYPFQYFPQFTEFLGEAPFLGFGSVVFTVTDIAVAVDRAAPVLLVRFFPSNEVSRKNSCHPPPVFDAPLLGDVVPGFQESGEIFRT